MNKEFISAIEECLAFHDLKPEDVEYNCGSVWFMSNGKKHFIYFGECEEE